MIRGRRQQRSDLCTAKEISELHGVLGSSLYLGRETRPDVVGPVSLLQGKFANPRVEDLSGLPGTSPTRRKNIRAFSWTTWAS